MNKPQCTIARVEVGNNCPPLSELKGFAEFDLWALRNNVAWARVSAKCREAHLPDADRIKLLAMTLLDQSEERLAQILKWSGEIHRFAIEENE